MHNLSLFFKKGVITNLSNQLTIYQEVFMINLILKLPNFFLLWLSGKKQIILGERELLPAFQLICEQNEKLGIQYSQISPIDLRDNYKSQNSAKIGLEEIRTSNHQVPVDGDTIEVRAVSYTHLRAHET